MSERAARPGSTGLICIIFVLSTFAWVDRSAIPLLVDPVKAHLRLTDTQVSILMGLAFTSAYSLASIPAGIVADRASRRGLLAVAATSWSVLLMGCAFVSGYWQLMLARMGVGAAESVINPTCFSLIGEHVPRERHGWAFSFMGMGPFMGGAIGLAGGGAILSLAASGALANVPVVNLLEGWQLVFLACGLISLPTVFLLPFLPRDTRRHHAGGDGAFGMAGVGTLVRERAALYSLLISYVCCSALLIFGITSWMPAMMARKFGAGLDEVGYIYGLQGLICGVAGLVIGGAVIGFVTRRNRNTMALAVFLVGLLTTIYGIMPLAPTQTMAWWLSGIGAVVAGPLYPIGSGVLARVTPAPMLGKMSVAFFLPQSVIGAGLGPTFVAMLSDTFFVGPDAIAKAMALFAAVIGTSAFLLALLLMRSLGRMRPEAAPTADRP